MMGWLRYRRWRKKWRQEDDGVVAVEFALIALPFFTLLFGLIEASLFFTSGIVLEGASNDAARLLRTGQVQMSANPEDTFEDELCQKVSTLLKCENIQYEVIRVDPNTFANAEANEPEFDDDGNLVPQAFATGNSNDILIVRTVYRYQFLTPFIGALITGDAGKDWLNHMSTVVLRAEPYIFGEE